MTGEQRGLVLLLRSAINDERLSLPREINLEGIFKEAARHGVVSLAYAGAMKCGIDKSLPLMQRILGKCYSELMGSEKQLFMLEKIAKSFEKEGIDYVFLKGGSLKKLYPKPEMRKMNDADVLVHEKDYEKAKMVVEKLGFVKDNRDSEHSRNFESEDLYLELHVKLVSENEFPRYANYFGDGWKRAYCAEGHRYEMSLEDQFIFNFAHFVKHYILGGIGCRQLCDLWILLEKSPEVDLGYIEQELEKLDLLSFYKNLIISLNMCFRGAEGNEKAMMIADFVLSSGQWGRAESYYLSKGIRAKQNVGNSSRVKTFTIFKSVFPPLSIMKPGYPVLKKAPWLLPFAWIARWIKVLFRKRDKIAARKREWALISSENIDEYEDKLRFVGLNLAD